MFSINFFYFFGRTKGSMFWSTHTICFRFIFSLLLFLNRRNTCCCLNCVTVSCSAVRSNQCLVCILTTFTAGHSSLCIYHFHQPFIDSCFPTVYFEENGSRVLSANMVDSSEAVEVNLGCNKKEISLYSIYSLTACSINFNNLFDMFLR